ncbi:MAG: PqqD family protein [Sterolibacterium sp.]|nr:PqqD family protein [Sterolibacterium sp.]
MYQANSPRIAHETLDGETIIIDTQTGFYYTLDDHAVVVWQALVDGIAPERIADAYVQAGLFQPDAVRSFIDQLLKAELLVEAGNGSAASSGGGTFSLPALSGNGAGTLVLKTHSDLQELIELDPIHEVDPTQGWPMKSSSDQ